MSIKNASLQKLFYIITFIIIIAVAFWQIKKIMLKPLYEVELAIVETSFAALDSDFNAIALENLKSIKSQSARDFINLEFSKYYANKGDFQKAIDHIKKIESSFNRQIAFAYTLAYQYSFGNKAEASSAISRLLNNYAKAFTYALIYIFTKDESFFEKSTDLAKNFSVGQKKVLAKNLTKEFESKNLYLENLKYWSIVDSQDYNLDFADLSKVILEKDMPYFAGEIKSKTVLLDFTKQMNLYREGKKSREETLEYFKKAQTYWFNKISFLLAYDMPYIVTLYKELDEKQQALDLIQYIHNYNKGIVPEFRKNILNTRLAYSYAKLGYIDKALDIINSEQNYNSKIESFNFTLKSLVENNDFDTAFKLIEYVNSLDFRFNLIFKYPHIKIENLEK